MIVLALKGHAEVTNFLQEGTPTADKNNEEVESFYKDIEDVMTMNKEVILILGDINTKIGQDSVVKWVGTYGNKYY